MNPEYISLDNGTITAEEQADIDLHGAPRKPEFPYMIVLVALFKDFIDIFSAGFLGILTSIIAGLVIWFWLLGKTNFIKKRLLRWFLKRFVIGMFIEILPIISMLPITTIMVLLTHNREKKIVQMFYKSLEKLNPLVRGI